MLGDTWQEIVSRLQRGYSPKGGSQPLPLGNNEALTDALKLGVLGDLQRLLLFLQHPEDTKETAKSRVTQLL